MSTISTRVTLLAKLHAGQPEAQREFAEIYFPVAKRYAEQFTGRDNPDADDIAQDVLFKLCLTKPISYDPTKNFRGLLMKAVKNRWSDLMKKQKREGTLPGDWIERVKLDVPDITDEEMQLDELLLALDVVIRNLSEQARTIFRRVALDGETAVAVAADLGMTAGAIRVALKRVRDKVREELVRRGIFSDEVL